MTDLERELMWRGLVASMPGDTHEDRVLSLVLYTARELTPDSRKVKSIAIRVDFDDRSSRTFTATKVQP